MITFKDLIKDCSPDDIIKYLDTDDVDEYKAFYEKLINTQPAETDIVLIGIDYAGCGKADKEVTAYRESELKASVQSTSELSGLSFEDVDAMDGETAGQKSFMKVLPEPVMYECEPWKEVLGYKVDQANAEAYGITEFVGDVMFKMVFFSFDEAEIAEIRSVIAENIAQVDEVRAMGEEERDKYVFSAERSAAYFSFQDNRPAEEKMEDMYEAARGTLKNLIREYRTVCGIQNL